MLNQEEKESGGLSLMQRMLDKEHVQAQAKFGTSKPNLENGTTLIWAVLMSSRCRAQISSKFLSMQVIQQNSMFQIFRKALRSKRHEGQNC